MNQFFITFNKKTGLYSVEIKGIKYTFSWQELDELMLLIKKILIDTQYGWGK